SDSVNCFIRTSTLDLRSLISLSRLFKVTFAVFSSFCKAWFSVVSVSSVFWLTDSFLRAVSSTSLSFVSSIAKSSLRVSMTCSVSFLISSSRCFTAAFKPLIFCSSSFISSSKIAPGVCFTSAKATGSFLLRFNLTTSFRDSYTLLIGLLDDFSVENSQKLRQSFSFQIQKPGWHETARAQRNAIRDVRLTRFGRQNTALFY